MALTPVGWDTETCLIRPGCLVPPMVCVSWQRQGLEARIASHLDALPTLRGWFSGPCSNDSLLVGHNVAFDLAVLCEEYPELRPAIFRALREDRVTDTMLREQLIDIAAGQYRGSVSAKGRRIVHDYRLESVAKRRAGMALQKDAWRLSYAAFRNVPLSKWPEVALEVQAKGRVRLVELARELEAYKALKGSAAEDAEDYVEALKEEQEGLTSMVEGDPKRCTEYPLDDARAPLATFFAQEKHAHYLKDQFRKTRGYFALYLESAWGLRTDAEGVKKLRESVENELGDLDELLVEAGLVRKDGTKDMKAAKLRMIEACAAEGIAVVRTDAHFEHEGRKVSDYIEADGTRKRDADGKKIRLRCKDIDGNPLDDGDDRCVEHISLDSDACERVDDPIVEAFSERSTLGKQLANDIPALEKGTTYPVHTRYGLAGTGRTTSSKPNIQNQSKREGFREAFIPRLGHLFFECDYPSLELYTWAQFCKATFGFSKLAEALNQGLDPHLMLAAKLLRVTYEEAKARLKAGDPAVKKARQQAKPGNFGFAGGMGPAKFVATTRKQMGRKAFEALELDEDGARRLKETWIETWPEAKAHFQRAAELCDNVAGLGSVESLFTERHRGRTTYCATCNTPFQGLGADIATEAAWLLAEAQYVAAPPLVVEGGPPPPPFAISPLFNTRTVAMIHDEFIGEVPEAPRWDGADAHDAAMELARLMVIAANRYLPDVPVPVAKMEPLLMRRWVKSASSVFGPNGRLIPWGDVPPNS